MKRQNRKLPRCHHANSLEGKYITRTGQGQSLVTKKCKMGSWPPLGLSLSSSLSKYAFWKCVEYITKISCCGSLVLHLFHILLALLPSILFGFLLMFIHEIIKNFYTSVRWQRSFSLFEGLLQAGTGPPMVKRILENHAKFYHYCISPPAAPSTQPSPSLAHPLQGAWTTPHCRSALLYLCIL